ncbi:MAG: VWA domain-containing protein [Myxococcota bacterium]
MSFPVDTPEGPLGLRGHVRWTRSLPGPAGEPVGVGIAFQDLDGGTLDRLASWLTSTGPRAVSLLVSFLFLAGLALSALASSLLLALYFLRLRRRKVVVSSLLPWQSLLRDEKLASPFQRFRRNLLLLVQLLLLALLVLAFARPFVESEAAGFRSVVLVVDTSASMGATDAEPTRLQAAVARAGEIVDGLGPADEVMVVRAGSTTAVALPFTRDHAAATRALAGLAVSEAEGTLEEAVSLALSLAKSRPDVQVVVLSDGGPRPLTTVEARGAAVRYERIGRSDRNAGIVALDLRRSPVSELDQQLFVTVRAFGRQPMDGSVEVYLDQRLVGLRNAALQPDAPVSMVFDLPTDGAGLLEVRLDAPDDALPADDRAVALLEPLGARKVLVVGGDPLLVKILANDPRVEASQIAPSAVTPEMIGRSDAVLFAGPVPDGMDGYDYAVLGPFPGGPVKFGEPVSAPKITGWQRTHPILRFTRWDDVLVGQARAVVDRGGLAPLVDGEHGPMLLAGQRAGGRVAQLAFDPYHSDLPLRVAWPILVLNLVGWLTEDPATGPAAQARTGQPFVRRLPDADADTTPTVRGPEGAGEAVVADGVLRVTGTDRVGVYRVTAGSTELRFAANLLSEGESRIAPRGDLGLTVSAGDEGAASAAMARRELWRPLLIAAVLVLLLEWALWSFRRSA